MITQRLPSCQISLPQGKDTLFTLRRQTLQILQITLSPAAGTCFVHHLSLACVRLLTPARYQLLTSHVTTAVTLPLTHSPPQWGLNEHQIVMTASPFSCPSQVCKLKNSGFFMGQLQHITPFKLCSFSAGLDQISLGC